MKCKNCKYYDSGHPELKAEGDMVGECRLDPPKVIMFGDTRFWGVFPAVWPREWCGQFKDR